MARYEDTGQENRQGPGYQLAPGLKAPPYVERRLQSAEGGFESGAAQAADMDYQEAEELDVGSPVGGGETPGAEPPGLEPQQR